MFGALEGQKTPGVFSGLSRPGAGADAAGVKRRSECFDTRLLVAHAVEGLGCDRVQIAHSPDNLASQRVIEKCDFVFEGRVRHALGGESVARGACRDLLCYSLLPEEARALPWYASAKASPVGERS